MEAELAAMATERKALGSALGHGPPGRVFGGRGASGVGAVEDGGARTFIGGVLLGDENAALLRQGTQVRYEGVEEDEQVHGNESIDPFRNERMCQKFFFFA